MLRPVETPTHDKFQRHTIICLLQKMPRIQPSVTKANGPQMTTLISIYLMYIISGARVQANIIAFVFALMKKAFL